MLAYTLSPGRSQLSFMLTQNLSCTPCSAIPLTPIQRKSNSFQPQFMLHQNSPHARFRSTRPVPVVAVDFAAVFLVVVVVPLRTEPAVVFLAAAPRDAAPFLTTVPELASLVSLLARDLRAVRVVGLEAGAREAVVVAARLVLVAAVVLVELVLAVEAVVTLRATPALVAFAFSTMLESMLVAVAERAVPEFFSGEAGRAMPDLTGEAGRDRFASLELEEVGERICAGRT